MAADSRKACGGKSANDDFSSMRRNVEFPRFDTGGDNAIPPPAKRLCKGENKKKKEKNMRGVRSTANLSIIP